MNVSYKGNLLFQSRLSRFRSIEGRGARGDGRGGSNPSYGQNYASEHNSSIMASA